MMKIYLVAGLALLATGCSSTYKPNYIYSEIRVVNNSRELLQEVTVTVPSTGRTLSCGNIAPLGICSNRFGKRRYEYNPIRIDWAFGNSAGQTDEFVVPVPATFSTGLAMRAVIAISEQGEISAYFKQESPL